ncbi:hypothetical protein D3C71_1875540 [compost metagenome]
MRRCLDPLASVQARSAHGGPAPILSAQRIAELRGALEAAKTLAAARRASVAAARATLKQEIAALASAPLH